MNRDFSASHRVRARAGRTCGRPGRNRIGQPHSGRGKQRRGTAPPTALGLGSSVFLNQEVSTGDAARLELKFLDGTQLTLGEKAK